MRQVKRILLVLSVLLLFPSMCFALVDFEYPELLYLSPERDSYNLYIHTSYQIDVDPSQYIWESTNEDVASISEKGRIWGKYDGTCRIIGTPRASGLKKIDIELNFPSFIYGGDYIEIDSPGGVFHEYNLQGSGISGMDYKVSGGVFKCEMASKTSLNGPEAMYLTPIKPGKGTLTYIYNSKYKIPVTVVVKESAFFSPSPVPLSTPVPAQNDSDPSETIEDSETMPDPKDYSGEVLRKTYEAYDYSSAKNTPEAYKGTSVYASGWVFMYKILDDGWGYALIFESESGKPVYITLPPGSVPVEGVDIGDNIEVYGVSQTLTETTPAYPIILTTMRIVNHGPRE